MCVLGVVGYYFLFSGQNLRPTHIQTHQDAAIHTVKTIAPCNGLDSGAPAAIQ